MQSSANDATADIVIRPIAERDLDAYRDLRLEALRAHPEAFGADYATDLSQTMEWWRGRAFQNGGVIQLAFAGNDMVGMMGLHPSGSPKMCHGAMLWGVYVRPAWWGRGVAERMIEECIAWGKAHGIRKVTLGVATTNSAAIRRYIASGFTVYGVEPEVILHDGVYHDELLMARRI